MGFLSWKNAVESLTAAMRPITARQQTLAKHAGISIGTTTPSIVASAMLRMALASHLHLAEASPVDEYRESRIKELRKYGVDSIKPKSLEEAKAWVDYLHLALRRTHL